MLMKAIEIRSEKLAKKCAEELNLEILEVSFVKENGSRILRIIADSKGGLTIDEATALNEKISDALDREDFIDEEYFLEVSSAGLERELKKEEDIINAIGEYICIKTYEKVENMKEIYGDLESYDGNTFVLDCLIKGRHKKITIDKKITSKVRMAVKF